MLENKIRSAKDFARKHRAKIAVVVTLAGCIAIQVKTAEQWNEFLKEHDLFDEYYADDED